MNAVESSAGTDLFCQKTSFSMRISFIGFPRNQYRWFWVHFWQDEDEMKMNAVEDLSVSRWEFLSLVFQETSRWFSSVKRMQLCLVIQKTPSSMRISFIGFPRNQCRWFWVHFWQDEDEMKMNAVESSYEQISSVRKHHSRWEFLSLVFQETNVDDSESISGKMKTKWRWMQLNLVTNRSLLSENIILDENFFHWFSKKPISMILSPFLARWRRNEDECSWI